MRKFVLLFLFLSPSFLTARSVLPLYLGTWTTGGTNAVTFTLGDSGKYTWNKNQGNYQVMDGQIWLLDKKQTGIKWLIKATLETLTLSRPEDFKYGGGRRYIYFQMTNPALGHLFNRVTSEK